MMYFLRLIDVIDRHWHSTAKLIKAVFPYAGLLLAFTPISVPPTYPRSRTFETCTSGRSSITSRCINKQCTAPEFRPENELYVNLSWCVRTIERTRRFSTYPIGIACAPIRYRRKVDLVSFKLLQHRPQVGAFRSNSYCPTGKRYRWR